MSYFIDFKKILNIVSELFLSRYLTLEMVSDAVKNKCSVYFRCNLKTKRSTIVAVFNNSVVGYTSKIVLRVVVSIGIFCP